MGTVQTYQTGSPESKYFIFHLNPDSKYYDMIRGEMGFQKVPAELKLEKVQKTAIIHSDFLIRGRIRGGKYLFFTGLLKTNFDFWYFGDYFEIKSGIKRNSFILFHFSPDYERFEMFFFNHFKLYPDKRGYFIRDFINHVKR